MVSVRSKKSEVEIQHREASKIAGFHLTGPWAVIAPQGFAKLVAWTTKHQLIGPWMVVYYGNPRVVPAQALEIKTVIGVPTDFALPEESEGVIVDELAAGTWASTRGHVNDGDFAKPWDVLFSEWLPERGYRLAEDPCFDNYLNDGSLSGEWDIELYLPIIKVD